MTTRSISSHSHMSTLEPSRAKLLWGVMQVNRRVGGCQEESELYSSFVHMCIYVCICACAEHPCAGLHVCLLLNIAVAPVSRSVESVWALLLCQLLKSPLTQRLLGSLGTQTAPMPSQNSFTKPWTSLKEAWYHESRESLAVGPSRTSSRQLPFSKAKF